MSPSTILRGGLAVATALLLAVPAGAQPVERRLDEAKARRGAAVARVRALARELADLSAEYAAAEADAQEAAARLLDAFLQEARVSGRLAHARELLHDRADAAYRAGPGGFLSVLLGSESFGDLLERGLLLERALMADVEEAADALEQRGSARRLRRRLEASKEDLQAQRDRLAGMREELQDRLEEADRVAARAGIRVREVERERRRLRRAASEDRSWGELLTAGADQSELLALLGPRAGRGCQIPPKLRPTGRSLQGEASFYGAGFAGRPTASGAIFVPELFTAAHRTLPLPSFLHVRYGDRCATVLVNDRGPYVQGRFLDLSEGAATYIGLAGAGVDRVRVEILVRR
jgi:peptidoglycan hydrolase CwlO-like protein